LIYNTLVQDRVSEWLVFILTFCNFSPILWLPDLMGRKLWTFIMNWPVKPQDISRCLEAVTLDVGIGVWTYMILGVWSYMYINNHKPHNDCSCWLFVIMSHHCSLIHICCNISSVEIFEKV
jgi:hypothetical protein